LAEQVEDFVGRYISDNENIRVKTFYENELMGSGGTVYANRDFIGEEEDFFICYADNLTNVNLKELLEEHKKNKAVLTMALFRTNLPKQCGIATLGKSGVITDFVEKPENPTSNLANAGIYVASKKLYKYFDGNGFCDFGKDILPKLTGEMYGYEIQAYLRDIGTIENLQLARKEWTYDNF
jgi:mannose-1-phosphate guanylyltransferase